MRRLTLSIALALCSLLCASISSAQQTSTTATAATTSVPSLIRYSGTLKDTQGATLASTTPVGVTFAIYNRQDGGAAVWQETQNVTADGNGQYSVLLGSTTAAGLPGDLFSQQEQCWLGVQVQGEAEQARVMLVSVPYAFKAHEADTLGGLPASAFVQAAPSNASSAASTGTGTAVNALGIVANEGGTSQGRVAASARKNPLPCNPVTSQTGGVANNIAIWDAFSNCDLSTSLMSQNTPSTVVTDSGYFNLLNIGLAYEIGGLNVLTIGPGGPNNLVATSNLFVGAEAGISATGFNNTFIGYNAGNINTGETSNTYTGSGAGGNASGSSMNSLYGYKAGYNNQSVVGGNSFFGYEAGMMNTSGDNNTFLGFSAGLQNTNGNDNTFVGYNAGTDNGNGQNDNTFLGYDAGMDNVTGNQNVFNGSQAGMGNNGGNSNVFVGYTAGKANVVGSFNTFVGYEAGENTQGTDNTFVGSGSGLTNLTGSNNTYIGGSIGFGNEDNTIRIGGSGAGPNSTYIKGIFGSTSSGGIPVYVNGNNQLGTQTSSLRFKEQVRDMGDGTNALMKLRPVTFFYKPQYDDGSHQLQYGLIAEEVARVYPELVAYDKDGQPYTVRYQYLTPMMLNELQKEHTVVMAQQDELQTQLQQIKAQRQEIDGLRHELQLQNASLQERLSKLESYVATQTQTKTASAVQPATAASPSGDSQ